MPITGWSLRFLQNPLHGVCMYVFVCMYVRMYVCCVCMYVMYVMHVMYVTYVMYVMYVMYICKQACVYVNISVPSHIF